MPVSIGQVASVSLTATRPRPPTWPQQLYTGAAVVESRLVAISTPVLTWLVLPVGVVLLWLSPRWHRRDKLIGTLAVHVPPQAVTYVAEQLRLAPALFTACAWSGRFRVSGWSGPSTCSTAS